MAFHTWISTDTPEHTACLVCGGMWVDTNPGSVVLEMGQITASNGEPAVNCTGNTQQCHHYQGDDECWRCSNEQTDLVCERSNECNCLFCN